jgi:hypothetical protein
MTNGGYRRLTHGSRSTARTPDPWSIPVFHHIEQGLKTVLDKADVKAALDKTDSQTTFVSASETAALWAEGDGKITEFLAMYRVARLDHGTGLPVRKPAPQR